MIEESYPCTCSSFQERLDCKELCDDRRKKATSRISRRNWTQDKFGILNSGGLTTLFDNHIKAAYRITDEEYDCMAEKMTDDEMGVFVTEKPTFSQKREMINLLNKYVHNEA